MKLIKKLFLILAMALSCFGIGIAGEADDIILPTTECDVCAEKIVNECFVTFSCGHKVQCYDCMKNHIDTYKKDRARGLRCPHRDCNMHITKRVNFQNMNYWNSLLGNEYMAELLRIITEQEAERGKAASLDTVDDEETKKLLLQNTKPCPQCGNRIEKNAGCMHMYCKCTYQFCWVCLGNHWAHNFKEGVCHEGKAFDPERAHRDVKAWRRQRRAPEDKVWDGVRQQADQQNHWNGVQQSDVSDMQRRPQQGNNWLHNIFGDFLIGDPAMEGLGLRADELEAQEAGFRAFERNRRGRRMMQVVGNPGGNGYIGAMVILMLTLAKINQATGTIPSVDDIMQGHKVKDNSWFSMQLNKVRKKVGAMADYVKKQLIASKPTYATRALQAAIGTETFLLLTAAHVDLTRQFNHINRAIDPHVHRIENRHGINAGIAALTAMLSRPIVRLLCKTASLEDLRKDALFVELVQADTFENIQVTKDQIKEYIAKIAQLNQYEITRIALRKAFGARISSVDALLTYMRVWLMVIITKEIANAGITSYSKVELSGAIAQLTNLNQLLAKETNTALTEQARGFIVQTAEQLFSRLEHLTPANEEISFVVDAGQNTRIAS